MPNPSIPVFTCVFQLYVCLLYLALLLFFTFKIQMPQYLHSILPQPRDPLSEDSALDSTQGHTFTLFLNIIARSISQSDQKTLDHMFYTLLQVQEF